MLRRTPENLSANDLPTGPIIDDGLALARQDKAVHLHAHQRDGNFVPVRLAYVGRWKWSLPGPHAHVQGDGFEVDRGVRVRPDWVGVGHLLPIIYPDRLNIDRLAGSLAERLDLQGAVTVVFHLERLDELELGTLSWLTFTVPLMVSFWLTVPLMVSFWVTVPLMVSFWVTVPLMFSFSVRVSLDMPGHPFDV